MASLTFAQQSDLSDQERVRRIGELIATAVIRYRRQKRTVMPPVETSPRGYIDPADLVGDETEKRLVRYLGSAGAATPHELGDMLGLSRTTVTRKLACLRRAGLVVVSGRTKGATYKLKTDFIGN
jgi:biotin operon repressor